MEANESAPRVGAGVEKASKRLRRPPRMVRNRRTARVRIDGKDHYLGAWGSKEAKARYAELVAQWAANDGHLPALLQEADPAGATVNEVIALYKEHELPARPPSMRERIKLALRPLRVRFGSKLASEFAALDLLTLRTELLNEGRLSRGMVNQNVALVRAAFTWAAAMGRIDERVAFRLSAVKPLRRGQGAREKKVVQPVDWPTVEATIAHANASVRGAVLFQWHTGARPGEALAMTGNDIDRTGKVWVYVPKRHKTAHHGKSRRIFIGREAQTVLLPFLVRRPSDAPLFSPQEAIEEQKATAAERRRTRVQPSQVARARRRKARPKRGVGEGYDVASYRRALERAMDAANAAHRRELLADALVPMATDEKARARIADAIERLPVFVKLPSRARLVRRVGDAVRADDERRTELAKVVADILDAPGRFERWHPHRLRHAFAHRAVREVGDLDAVRCALGHATDAMTRHYSKPDDHKARLLAEAMG